MTEHSPIVVAGHSHMLALVGDVHTLEPELYAVADFTNVFALHAPWPRRDDYWEHLRDKGAGRRIALVWGGNEHNLYFFFESSHPFDFVSRHVNKLISTFRIVPQRLVRHKFRRGSLLGQLGPVLALLGSGKAESISVVGTPPPKKDSEQLRKILVSEPHFVDWAAQNGESLDTVKITSPHIRLKLWFLVQEMLAEAAAEAGAKFIPIPAEVQDDEGFLLPDYWAEDVTHANHLYGRLMLGRIIEELA